MSPRAYFIAPNGEARWASLVLLVIFVGGAAWIESCSMLPRLLQRKDDTGLKFSHSAHADNVQGCTTCHFDQSSGIVVRASHTSCVQCHVAADIERPVDSSCLSCHTSLPPTRDSGAPRPDYAQANFDHANHDSVSCAKCHGAVNQPGMFSRVSFPRMEDCLSCHFPGLIETSSAECFTCHLGITPDDAPETHYRGNWPEAHGIASMADPDRCVRCHVKARDCATCHSSERPPSHTASFRARLHGFHALNNPISCETCHAQGFCEACHQTTEPASHTGSFKDRPFLHCAGCHLPLEEGNRCSVCHRGNPHDNVFALPPPPFALDPSLGRVRPIVAGESCFPCHIDSVRLGIAPRITHPFNTISPFECIQCHKPS